MRHVERERDLLTFHANATDESSQAIAEHEKAEVSHKRASGATLTTHMQKQASLRQTRIVEAHHDRLAMTRVATQVEEEKTRKGVAELGKHAARVGGIANLTAQFRSQAEPVYTKEYHQRANEVLALKQSTEQSSKTILEANATAERRRKAKILAQAPEREAILDAGGNPDAVFRARAVEEGNVFSFF